MSNHQLAVILPTESYYIFPIVEEYQFDKINESSIKEFNRNLDSAYRDVFGDNGVWTEQDYKIKIHQVQEYLLVTHSLKILMADSFFSHPDTTYWIASVEMNAPVDPDAMSIDLDIHCKTMYTSNKVKTKMNINKKLVRSQWGCPICIYLVDNQYSEIKQYVYQGIE